MPFPAGRRPVRPWKGSATGDSSRTALALYLCFHDQPLAGDVPFDWARYGAPARVAMSKLRLVELNATDNPDAFRLARAEGVRLLAEQDLGRAASQGIERLDRATRIAVEVSDPADLTHLQAAWACIRWLSARGAVVVQDLIGARWFEGAALLAAKNWQEFDIHREVRVVFDAEQTYTDPSTGKIGRVLNTRGMRKFARPDIVTVTNEAQYERLENLVFALADSMARGFMPEAPRHGVDLSEDESVYLHLGEDSDALVSQLALENDAVVLRDEQGRYFALSG